MWLLGKQQNFMLIKINNYAILLKENALLKSTILLSFQSTKKLTSVWSDNTVYCVNKVSVVTSL